MASVSESIAARLPAWGVDRVFGFPGREVDSLISAIGEFGDGPQFVQVRHEESAALMACAHAKLTGRPGCCLAPSGAGALHLLSGLYDAVLDRQPVVALIGQETPPAVGHSQGRAVRMTQLFAEASAYCESVSDVELVGDALDRAIRTALTDRGAATLIIPRRVLEAQTPLKLREEGESAASRVDFNSAELPPGERDVRRAVDVLNEGRRVAVVVGSGAAGASGQVVDVAETLNAGVAKTPLARDLLPDDLPYVTGVLGPYGSAVAAALLRDCDTLLLVGAEDVDAAHLVQHIAGCRVVTVDPEAGACPVDVGPFLAAQVTGDVDTALEAIIPRLRRKRDRGWRADVERAVRAWRATGRVKAGRFFGTSVNPRSVVAELSQRLPDRAVVVTDCGSALDWWTRHLEVRHGMRSLLSGHLAMPGAAVPYAVAARFAYPDRPVVALVGDGAFQASGLNELITVQRHLKRLAVLPPLVFCVLNNQDLNRLTWQRRSEAGDPLIPRSEEVPDVSYAEYARLLGLRGVRCDRPRGVGAVWNDVFASRGPVVLEFAVDGDMPPDWAAVEGGRNRPLPRLSRRGLRRRAAAAIGGLFRPM